MCKTQDELMHCTDTYEEALTGLNETVATNHESYDRQLAEIRAMLEAIIKDQNVPYKPPMGFMQED